MTLYALDGVAPELSKNVWVAPGAHVLGRVTLHEGVSIWFGAVLRGDTEVIEIGAGSNVQDNVVIHADPGFPTRTGPGCTIGHRVMLHGCTIGANSLIGMGATVLNGARIGADCLIGAGALVGSGDRAPALVGDALPGERVPLRRRARRGPLNRAGHGTAAGQAKRAGETAATTSGASPSA
ncbi:MAG: gamma carbonic anhydrase family protein [Alphaproteobacteria bacterium HGW-Alphaproteobacteria-2]|nr:MAG: gamma carbonic anhydrase family protein [Alphaproteobacteria bacterium HGW-Alphaproteobacteria-2]